MPPGPATLCSKGQVVPNRVRQSGARRSLNPMIALIAAVVAIVVAYLGYDLLRSKCDTLFNETATAIKANLSLARRDGELLIGREDIRKLDASAENLNLLLKSCCGAQEHGGVDAAWMRNCIDGARDGVSQAALVATSVHEAAAARARGDSGTADEKVAQARQAIARIGDSEVVLARAVADATVANGGTGQPDSGTAVTGNNTVLTPVTIAMGGPIAGDVAAGGTSYFFRFQYDDEKKRRDYIRIRIENLTTTLQPQLRVYHADKSVFQNWAGANAAGADVASTFGATPGESFIIEITGIYNSTGRYRLFVEAQHLYDQYEPNDDAFTATPLKTGVTIDANIMDSNDQDWYRISGISGKSATVRLINKSSSLQPKVMVRRSDKSIQSNWQGANAAGADLSITFDTEAGQEYYVIVGSDNWTSGAYRLTVE
jgi:hypothetical protein